MKKLIIILVGVLSGISLVHAKEPMLTELKLLPYVEADVEFDSDNRETVLTWATPTHVLFGTFYNSSFVNDPKYCGNENPLHECKKPTFERTKVFMVFDISSKKTTFNIKNEFYESQLEVFNQHRYWDTFACPYMSREGATLGYIALKENDGCIKEIEVDTFKHVRRFSYVRPDGESVDIIEKQFGDNLRFWAWVDWLKAYLLRTHVSLSTTHEGDGKYYVSSPPSFILLSPNSGKFNFVDVGEHVFSGATVTRAGLIVYLDSNINSKIPLDKQGLTLFRDNKRYLIAKEKGVFETAVSHDGCHVAYLVPRRSEETRDGYKREIIYNKLRVIDVCEEFGVAKDANPFGGLLK